EDTNIILTIKPEPFLLTDSFEEAGPGFIFHPFDNTQPGLFIKADIQFTFHQGRLQTEGKRNEQAIEWFNTHLQESGNFNQQKKLPIKKSNQAPSTDYKDLVQQAIRFIE